jgi:hypothetical protein
LAEENSIIRENLQQQEYQNQHTAKDGPTDEELLMQDLQDYQKYRRQMEEKLQNFENRIKHMMNKNDNVVKDISTTEAQTDKIVDVRKFKNQLDGDLNRAKEEKNLDIRLKKEQVNKANYYRDKKYRNNKMSTFLTKLEKVEELQMEKEKNREIKEKMDVYEKILNENKKLRSTYKSKKVEKDRECTETKNREARQRKIEEQLMYEREQTNAIDTKINQLQKTEENLIQQLGYSMTKRNQVKNRLTEIIAGNKSAVNLNLPGEGLDPISEVENFNKRNRVSGLAAQEQSPKFSGAKKFIQAKSRND